MCISLYRYMYMSPTKTCMCISMNMLRLVYVFVPEQGLTKAPAGALPYYHIIVPVYCSYTLHV